MKRTERAHGTHLTRVERRTQVGDRVGFGWLKGTDELLRRHRQDFDGETAASGGERGGLTERYRADADDAHRRARLRVLQRDERR